MRHVYPKKSNLWIDLLDPKTDRLLRQKPETLAEMIRIAEGDFEYVVIDEIQKNPVLLDVVHGLIFEKKYKFAITGSSARKLKRGAANLLAGRAFRFECHPMTHVELGTSFDLDDCLAYGSLPEVIELSQKDKQHFLRAYVDTYFKEEVVAEQLVRNLMPFRNFLEVASQSTGKILNMNNIAKVVGVDHTTVQNYFSILDDTMLGFLLLPYSRSIRKRQRAKSKFYYFDTGVQRTLTGLIDAPLNPESPEYGTAFEHYIVLEFKRLISYLKPDWRMSYLMTSDNVEVDLVIERPKMKTVLIEIKSTDNILSLNRQKLSGYKKLAEDFKNSESYVISRDQTSLMEGEIKFIHWSRIFKTVGLIK